MSENKASRPSDFNTKSHRKSYITFPSIIRKRQYNAAIGSNQRWAINDGFLPNHVNVVDRGEKIFSCGLYSEDGTKFMSLQQENVIKIYDATTPALKCTHEFKCKNEGWILDAVFSPCGNYVLYCKCPGKRVYLYNIEDQVHKHVSSALYTKDDLYCGIFPIKFSGDCKMYLSAITDCYICIHDLEIDKQLLFKEHTGTVYSMAFLEKSSKIFVSGGADTICRIWDIRCLNENRASPVGFLYGHRYDILHIDSKNDGKHFLTNSHDQCAKLWDIRMCREQKIVDYFLRRYNADAYDDPIIPEDRSVMTYVGHILQRTLMRCRFSPQFNTGQRYTYAGSADGKVIIYNTNSGKIVKELDHKNMDCIRDVHWHPHRIEIASSSRDGQLGIWTYESKGEGGPRAKKMRLETGCSS